MARYNPDDHGPPDSMGGLHDAAEAVRSAGRGGDTVLAHINPREAALLKAHGGSGTINPKTGLLEFDEYDPGPSSSSGGSDPGPSSYYDPGPIIYSYDTTPSMDYFSQNLGAMTGGYEPIISYGTDTLAQMQGYNDLWNSANYGLNDIISSITSPVNDFYNLFADSLNSNINSITSSLPSVSQVIDYITPDYSQYVDPTKLVQQPEFVKQPAFGSDQPNVGATVQSDADRAAMTGVGQDLTTPTGTIYYTIPSATGGATLGVGAKEVAEGLTVLTPEQLVDFLAGKTTTDSQSQVVTSASDLAKQAETINKLLDYSGGTVIGKNEISPSDLAKQAETINRLLDYSGGTVIGKSDAAPVDVSTSEEKSQPNVTLGYTAPTDTYSYDPNANVGVLGLNGPYGLAQDEIGNGVGPGNLATTGFSEDNQLPNVTLDYEQPKTGVQLGGSEDLKGQFTVGGVEGYRGGETDPYGDYIAVGPDDSSDDSSDLIVNKDIQGGDGFSTDLGPAIDVATLNTIDVPQTAKGTGSLDPNLFATTNTADAVTRTLSEQSDALTSLNQQLNNQIAEQGSTLNPNVTPTIDPLTGAVDTVPVTTPVTTPKTRIIGGREYLGLGNSNKYGSGAERVFFRPWQKEVAAADGGYFDADSYFSDGGLTTPSSQPSMPTMSSFPTMAFTDGQGAVGNIAQPPGLLPSDAVGSDAPHASPMAPSSAAAAPSMSTLQQTLGARNTNASPAMAPVPQNPNVGYALGQSPLSSLRKP